MPVVNMRNMKKGQRGRVAAIRAQGELGRRIRDMGVFLGAEVLVQGRAPLYDPVALRVGGCTISLRTNEADCIDGEVE